MQAQLEKLMTYYTLSPAKFAEKLGVQRSSVSHIMSGRNKPSYDFLIRILQAFPDINSEWLLLNKGNMLKDQPTQKVNKAADIKETSLFTNVNTHNKPTDKTIGHISKQKEHVNSLHTETGGKAEIERIVLLESDGTFKIYSHK